ncbi:MAG: RNA polymerase sigma factor [Myxococcota bacterium]
MKDVRDEKGQSGYQDSDDRELIRLFSKGDRGAFDEFYKRYYFGLVRFVMSYCNDRTLAEDVVQDIFLKLMDFRIRLGFVKNIKGYIYSAVINRCRDILRQRRDYSPVDDDRNEDFATVDKGDEIVDARIVNRLVERLPQTQREVLLLRISSNLPFKEIAGILKISENSAKVNYFYAVTSLRKMIGEENINE